MTVTSFLFARVGVMRLSDMPHRMQLSCLVVLYLLTSLASAYRPVQHCKIVGDSGQYSACAALTQHYNETTGRSDLYVKYNWFRYQSSKLGWHSFALGHNMAGALMLIMYGDPTAAGGAMTISVRSATGHHPPQMISDISDFDKYVIPDIEIVKSEFHPYNGDMFSERLQQKPSHIGVAGVIVRGYETWPGVKVDNTSTSQEFVWSSNSDQNMNGDYSVERGIEAHQFGLGFGFLYVDMLNAITPQPIFGPIDELAGLKGVNENSPPTPPTEAELAAGQAFIETFSSPFTTEPDTASNTESGTDEHDHDRESQTGAPVPFTGGHGDPDPHKDEQHNSAERPERTLFGKTIRDWMWHLHGLLMVFSYMFLYPLGTYLLRRPPKTGTGFNSHWTIQVLSTISAAIGSLIGWFMSHSISVKHQYIGLFLLAFSCVQMALGWRHHVIFIATKTRTWYSVVHTWSGRGFLLLGYVNIVLGMRLRRYGWFTMLLVLVAMVLEGAFLAWVLADAVRNKRTDVGANVRQEVSVDQADAEEYFQLTNEDEFSDEDDVQDSAAQRQQERREQAQKLSKLDRV